MDINSHIQIPNGILKYFRDESDPAKQVWYLDIHSGDIKRKPSSRLGTSKGYYSRSVEGFWNKYIESPLTKLNTKIRDFCDGKVQSLTISPEDQSLFKLYIKAAAVRSNLAYNAMKESSLTAEFFTEQENHDALAYFGMSSSGELDHLLEGMDITILINRTARDLVVPRNCYYCVSSLEKLTFVAPIFPKGALLLLPTDYPQNYKGYYAVIENPEQIGRMNLFALKYEFMFNGEFVASNHRTELEILQHFRNEHLSALEALKQKS